MKKKFLLKKKKQNEFLKNFAKKNILILRVLESNQVNLESLKKLCLNFNLGYISFSNKHLKSIFHNSSFFQNIFTSKIIFIYNINHNNNDKDYLLLESFNSINNFLTKNSQNFAILGFCSKNKLYNSSSTSLFLTTNEQKVLYEIYSFIFLFLFFQLLEFLKIQKENLENL